MPVVVLDRPNPVGGILVEGPVLQDSFRSFVGPLSIPQRHGLTLGEAALYAQKNEPVAVELSVIKMEGWKRDFLWQDLHRPWINPSPNLSTPESAISFCGTVLFEGTNISEGRGTTRALECVGHPGITNPWAFREKTEDFFNHHNPGAECILRPLIFHPMFQKHKGKTCGGVHIHPLEKTFRSHRLGAILLKMFKRELGDRFAWAGPPYEYEREKLPIDIISGGKELRGWVDDDGSLKELESLLARGHGDFIKKRREVLLY